jgi:hypothetical protein
MADLAVARVDDGRLAGRFIETEDIHRTGRDAGAATDTVVTDITYWHGILSPYKNRKPFGL